MAYLRSHKPEEVREGDSWENDPALTSSRAQALNHWALLPFPLELS